MVHRLPFWLVTPCLFIALWPRAARGEEVSSATIVVSVPADAKIYFGDELTRQTGVMRTFITPELQHGKIYVYDVKVEVNRGGKSATKTKEITVRAGVMTLVSFDELGPLPMPGGAQRITFKYERAGGRGRECSAAFSPDKRTVLRVQNEGNPILDDKSVRLYEAETGKALGPKISLRGRLVTALAIAPDGKTVATGVSLSVGGDEGDVRVWDATTGRQLARYEGHPPLGGVRDLEFSKDGRTVTITSGDYSGK